MYWTPRHWAKFKHRYQQSGHNKQQSPIADSKLGHLQAADHQHMVLLFICLSVLQHTRRPSRPSMRVLYATSLLLRHGPIARSRDRLTSEGQTAHFQGSYFRILS
jgi:hypothetical protein